jgi:hypothetical protein
VDNHSPPSLSLPLLLPTLQSSPSPSNHTHHLHHLSPPTPSNPHPLFSNSPPLPPPGWCGVERCWGVVEGSEESTPNPPLNLPHPLLHLTLLSPLTPHNSLQSSHLPLTTPLHHHSTPPSSVPHLSGEGRGVSREWGRGVSGE